jgi:hypothetical protein
MLVPPTGQDSLHRRKAYFRKRRSRIFGDSRLTAVWVTLGAMVSLLLVAGFTVLVLGS